MKDTGISGDHIVKFVGVYSRKVLPNLFIKIIDIAAKIFNMSFSLGIGKTSVIPQPETIKHEFLIVCVEGQIEQSTHTAYVVLDRASRFTEDETRNQHGKKVFTTLIRVVATFTDNKNCDKDSPGWPENKDDSKTLIDKNHIKKQVKLPYNKFDDLLRASIAYANNFPEYKPFTYNCQHFATGLYNALATENAVYTNQLLMDVKELENKKDFTKYFKKDTEETKKDK